MILARVSKLFFVLAVCGILGCEDDDALAPPAARQSIETYYPLALNRPAFYRVDSVVLFNTVGGIVYDSTQTEARETLVETFTGADGQQFYRGERWERRAGTNGTFRFKQTFTVAYDGERLVRSEDNLSFIKLVEPIRQGVRWDGNVAFDTRRELSVGGEFLDVYDGWDYSYTTLDTTLTLEAGQVVDEVVRIQQANVIDNLIDRRVAYELYAPETGLIERFVDARHTQYIVCCNRDPSAGQDLSWDEKAEKGYLIHERLIRRE